MALAHNVDIVKNSLVFYVDFANPRCYPRSGTTVNDISSQARSGELVNSPTFNSGNAGYFQFVTDDFIRFTNNTALDTQTPSVEVWVKTNSLNQNGFWFEKATVNTQYSLFQEGSSIVWRHALNIGGFNSLNLPSSSVLSISKWSQVVGTFQSGDRRIYVDGVQRISDSPSLTLRVNTGGMSIGAYGGYDGPNSYYLNGNLAIVRVYNKVLTPAEVRQNFEATRDRFEI